MANTKVMRRIAIQGLHRWLLVELDWDGDLRAIGIVMDRNYKTLNEAPVGAVLRRGYWEETSGLVRVKRSWKLTEWVDLTLV